jgi:hypothetical protein
LALLKLLDNPTLPAALAGAVALVAVSLLTPRTAASFEEVVGVLEQERQQIEGAALREAGLAATPQPADAAISTKR